MNKVKADLKGQIKWDLGPVPCLQLRNVKLFKTLKALFESLAKGSKVSLFEVITLMLVKGITDNASLQSKVYEGLRGSKMSFKPEILRK